MFNSNEIVRFQEETFDEVIDDMRPLLQDHWEEIALYQEHIDLDPDYEKYKALNDAGVVRIFTAREDGELIGYFVVMITPHMHYSSHDFAMNDIIYLKRDARSLGIGKKLISFVENVLKGSGVSVLMINTKSHQPFDPLMKLMGYDCVERIYGKYIGE